ncbi:hypothetical protein PIB30_021152 [Stylosanthes scabra]|uniref:Uncharacterized protein n=1 Tax=Stylosanthes scabra TaxID=79078 RepID=A0ABU6S8S2_9FABA|nr:hypothetical protein [Stylosanthes scabra]
MVVQRWLCSLSGCCRHGLSNWPGSLTYYMYYGFDRTKNAEDLMSYDLVLTKVDSPVKKVVWRRLTLSRIRGVSCRARWLRASMPGADVSNKPDLLQKLVEKLQDEDYDCPICLHPKQDLVITKCAHVFSNLRRTNPAFVLIAVDPYVNLTCSPPWPTLLLFILQGYLPKFQQEYTY